MTPHVDVQRRDPVRLSRREVVAGELTGAEGEQPAPELPAVQRVATPGGDRPQRAGNAGTTYQIPWRVHLGEQLLAAGRRPGGDLGGQAADQLDRRREPVVCVVDRPREHLVQRQPTEPLVQRHPAVDAAGHGDGADVVRQRHLRGPTGPETLGIGTASGTPAGVQHDRRAETRAVDDGPQVAAHPARLRAGHGEHRVRRECGVYGASASREHVGAGGRCQVLVARHHAARRSQRTTRMGLGGHEPNRRPREPPTFSR